MIKRGIGVGCMFYGIGYGFSRQDISSATIEVCEDGSVTIRSGQIDYGQGSDTICCQIVAEELGVNYDEIQLITPDTFATPNAGPTSASRVTYVTGMVMKKAAAGMRETLRPMAEELVGATDLVWSKGQVFSKADPSKSVAFRKLAFKCHMAGCAMAQTAWHDITTLDVDHETGQGKAYSTFAWAGQVAVVDVDTDTGKVDVVKVVAAHDVGKAINPATVEGQIEGGVVMGIGYALEEEIKQSGGYLKTHTLGEYMVPTTMDIPDIETHIVEVPVEGGPYGAKGVGEPASIPTGPAILSAICNALDISITELPANLENLHRIIREKGTSQEA